MISTPITTVPGIHTTWCLRMVNRTTRYYLAAIVPTGHDYHWTRDKGEARAFHTAKEAKAHRKELGVVGLVVPHNQPD